MQDHVSLEQLESAILGLTPDERQRLAVWFEENRRELLGDDPDELSEEQKAEVVRRRELALAYPELLEPWDGTIERVRERLHPPTLSFGVTSEFHSRQASLR
jgi:hypothetical protein